MWNPCTKFWVIIVEPKRSIGLTPNCKWDGQRGRSKITILDKLNSNYAISLEARHSASGYCVLLKGSHVGVERQMKCRVTL
jgi:hypothetical protein